MGIRRWFVSVLESIGQKLVADPEDIGYTEAEVTELIEQAEGELDRETLIGTNFGPPSPLQIIREGELPQYYIAGGDFAVEGVGRETDGGAGWLFITDERLLFQTFTATTESRNSVPYSSIESVEWRESVALERMTIRTKSQTYTIRTNSNGGDTPELSRELDYIEQKSGQNE